MTSVVKTNQDDVLWEDCEIDIWMIDDNLGLSYEERIAQHQDTLDCVAELKKMRADCRAKPPKSNQVFGSEPA